MGITDYVPIYHYRIRNLAGAQLCQQTSRCSVNSSAPRAAELHCLYKSLLPYDMHGICAPNAA